MGAWNLETLPWLLAAPEDLRARLRELRAGEAVDGAALRDLAGHALNLNALVLLDRALGQVEAAGSLVPGPLAPVRLALLADGTTDYAVPAIRASALRHGLVAAVYVPDYGQAMQEVLNPGSGLARFGAEVALVARDHRALGLARVGLDAGAARRAVDAALAETRRMVEGLGQAGVRSVVLQTVPAPAEPWCGHFDRCAPGSVAAQVAAYNAGLAALAAEHSAVILDIAALAGTVGRARWFDHAHWHRAKLPFAMDIVPLYAEHVARVLGAVRGRSRKCLALDLDNTLWGGVIGDDGLEGIRIGQGSPEGEAFLAVQRYALDLKVRGIVLAVCSKNEEDAARLPFRSHPDMALREDDFALFVANWTDKASNIRHIARALNIGTDAIVLLDDNPAERARIRQMLPEVAVPELPDDPAWYPAALAHAGYFETVGLSAEDAARPEQYRANADRAVALEKFGDYDAYLASLEMVCDMSGFDAVGRTRIAQLINKSNQFNLTTRRYTEAEIRAMEADPGIFALQVRLTDRFGDNGMISVVIFARGEEEWACDTWLMSCRVLGRRVEEAVLAAVARAARAAGATRLVGAYIPSARNAMVRDHFARMGFAAAGEAEGGGTRWVLDLAGYSPPELPMTVNEHLPVPGEPAGAARPETVHHA